MLLPGSKSNSRNKHSLYSITVYQRPVIRRRPTMNEINNKNTSRREFLKDTGLIDAASALAAGIAPRMYAGQNNTIKVALIGCGGRGDRKSTRLNSSHGYLSYSV